LKIGEDEMKRDKVFVIFIVFVSFAITGLLHYMRSPQARRAVPYLNALESSLSVFGEGKTNEFYSLNSQLKPAIVDNIIPIEYFVEEQRIIEEFDNVNQVNPILCRDEPADYISFYISLTNEMNMYGSSRGLRINNEGSCDTIFTAPHKSIRIANSNRHIIHIIKANDSLFKLAKRYYHDGSKWEKIYQANRNEMSDPNSLTIGQELIIPSSKEDKYRIIKT